jgi:DNA polymerase II small subunit
LVHHEKPEIYEKAKDVFLDDVIGIKCSGSREIVFVNDIVFPEAGVPEKKRNKKEEYAAFISDIHAGSGNFLEENFSRFVEWINGKYGKEGEKVNYLFVVGDNVDGVGIFPTQEEQLKIKDIKEQYKKLAEFFGKIRKDVKIFMCPGQHDAVRVAEPQPIIDKNYAAPLFELENLYFVSNPSMIEVGDAGIKVLMYHGASMHTFINEIEELRLNRGHDTPAKVVKEMLKRRHLAPTHSSVVYVPGEDQDPLAIREVPDIITTGEVHRPDIDIYNNILIICNSCWQSITPFEEKVGNNPLPCKVPLLNLKTREIKLIDFAEQNEHQ